MFIAVARRPFAPHHSQYSMKPSCVKEIALWAKHERERYETHVHVCEVVRYVRHVCDVFKDSCKPSQYFGKGNTGRGGGGGTLGGGGGGEHWGGEGGEHWGEGGREEQIFTAFYM